MRENGGAADENPHIAKIRLKRRQIPQMFYADHPQSSQYWGKLPSPQNPHRRRIQSFTHTSRTHPRVQRNAAESRCQAQYKIVFC